MKKLFWTFIAVFTFLGCFGQRYEAWVRTSENHRLIKGNYGFSNDSILMIYSNPSLFFPSRDTYFSWDDVTALQVRNKSRNQTGQYIGWGVGLLASYLIIDASQKPGSIDPGLGGIYTVFTVPLISGSFALIGHLVTKKKTDIPLNGMNSKDRNRLLKSTIQKRSE